MRLRGFFRLELYGKLQPARRIASEYPARLSACRTRLTRPKTRAVGCRPLVPLSRAATVFIEFLRTKVDSGLQGSLGGRHDALHARVGRERHAQRAAKGLEHGFGDMVGIAPAQGVNVQRHLSVVDEALEEFGK